MKARLKSLIMPASLGLNLALGGLIAYQAINGDDYRRDRRGYDRDRDRYSWSDDRGRRSMPDSVRSVPHLDREQVERLRNMRTEMWEEIQPMRESVRELQSLMRAELLQDSPRLAYLDSLTIESMQLQRAIQVRSLRLILEEREILTPEQYQRFLRYMVPGSFDTGDSRYREGSQRRRSGGKSEDEPPVGQRPNRPPPNHSPPGHKPYGYGQHFQ